MDLLVDIYGKESMEGRRDGREWDDETENGKMRRDGNGKMLTHTHTQSQEKENREI